ncbi:Rho family guanine nucleotide exchange factor TUS1 [Nakaseomyces bracarensis]|uniref:Rho family guanine nucleotide exchange factor TUS1 n=1 Tax=Nakaseomyces bracarensis TaxID=273131 RepID=UPI0038714F85
MYGYNTPERGKHGNGRSPQSRGSPQRQNPTLPQLPPLNTRSSFLDGSEDSAVSDVSIGWTPLGEQKHSHSKNNTTIGSHSTLVSEGSRSPLSPRYARENAMSDLPNGFSPLSISSSSNTKVRRRPPPPITRSTDSLVDAVPSLPASPFINKSNRSPAYRKVTPMTNNYKSPFIGEQELKEYMAQYDQTPSKKVYKSPFVGDPDSEIIIPSSSTAKAKDEKIVKSTTNEIEFYMKPPAPLTSSRNITGISRYSDQVESFYSDSNYTFNNSSARNSSFNSFLGARPLEYVPSITAPTQIFSIELLDEHKLYQCYSIYKLSDIYEWLLKVYFEWFNEYIFEKLDFFQIVQLLLEFQSPKNFEQELIDSNVDKIMSSLIIEGALRFELEDTQEIAVIVAGLSITGIFTELLPCYSFVDNTFGANDYTTICYSTTCCNRLSNEGRQEIKVSEIINKSVGLWTDYWKLSAEELSEINPKEIQRQSFIFDLIILEERSLSMANAAIEIYGKNYDPSLLPDEPNFASLAFDIFQPLIEIHKEYILKPIFWKIKTKGKFIDGIGKIYLKWCHEARDAYLKYSTAMATVHEIISWEKDHDTNFGHWLREVDNYPEITRSKMYHDVIFFGGYFKSLQNMPVTLSSILKNTDPSNEDYELLSTAIKEVAQLSSNVDQVHGFAIDRRKLVRFSRQLVYNSNSKGNTAGYINIGSNEKTSKGDKLALGLTDPLRLMINSGVVLKKSEHWIEPYPVFIALLDNFFLITEIVVKGSSKKYKLLERPIPAEYLSLEMKRKPDESPRSSLQSDLRPTSQMFSDFNAENISKNESEKSFHKHGEKKQTGISNYIPNSTEYAFKIRNTATNDSFTFYVSNHMIWDSWMSAFRKCFQNLNKGYSRNVFNVDIVSSEFSYEDKNAPINLPVAPDGSEIDIALKKYAKNTAKTDLDHGPGSVYCATCLEYEESSFIIIATNRGVYIRKKDATKTLFTRVLQNNSVKRLQVVPKLGLLFALDGQKLCYFSITSILAAYYDPIKYLSANCVVGIVLKDKVGYFKFADDFGNSRQLFYERKGKIVVATPEFHSIMNTFKCFKVYKKFILPSSTKGLILPEVFDIIIFSKSFMVCTKKSVILYNDTFNEDGISLPVFLNDKEMLSFLKHPHLKSSRFGSSSTSKDDASLAMIIDVKKDIATGKTKPVTAFKLQSGSGYILIYDEAIVKINNVGLIPDWKKDILILDFYCTGASYDNGYLFLIGDNLILIYNLTTDDISLNDLTPIQIINSKKIALLSSDTCDHPMVTSSHPIIPNRQLIFSCLPSSDIV